MATLMARSIVDTTVFKLYSARDNAVRDRGAAILIHTVTPLCITVYITVAAIVEIFTGRIGPQGLKKLLRKKMIDRNCREYGGFRVNPEWVLRYTKNCCAKNDREVLTDSRW